VRGAILLSDKREFMPKPVRENEKEEDIYYTIKNRLIHQNGIIIINTYRSTQIYKTNIS
jgi:hypothetical protein